MLTDKKTETPLNIRITEVLTELAKILGTKLDVVQKSWKMLGKVKPSKDEFNDPSEVRRWLKNRVKPSLLIGGAGTVRLLFYRTKTGGAQC